VREEKSSSGVVRIDVGVGVFVIMGGDHVPIYATCSEKNTHKEFMRFSRHVQECWSKIYKIQ